MHVCLCMYVCIFCRFEWNGTSGGGCFRYRCELFACVHVCVCMYVCFAGLNGMVPWEGADLVDVSFSHVCMHACMCVCVYIYIYIYIYIAVLNGIGPWEGADWVIDVRISLYSCMYVCMYPCMRLCVCPSE
jgi:hypothetical protein